MADNSTQLSLDLPAHPWSPASYGRVTAGSWRSHQPAPQGWDRLWLVDVMSRTAALTVHEAIGTFANALEHSALARQSGHRYLQEAGRFVQHLEAAGIETVDQITSDLVLDFIHDPLLDSTGALRDPSSGTMKLRRSVLRELFRHLRDHGFADGDPTLDLKLPSQGPGSVRPLTDEEEQTGRAFTGLTLVETRLPSLWALGQAGATTGEMPFIRITDLDLERRLVWLHGSKKRDPRYAPLTEWGVEQLARRLDQPGFASARPTTPIAYEGSDSAGASPQASVATALRKLLLRSGLAMDKSIKPVSLAAWFGRSEYNRTGSIEECARALGCRSLDQTATIIGHAWR